MHPIMILAFVLVAAVAFAPISYFASAPDVSPMETERVDVGPVAAGLAPGGEVATPNHDTRHVKLTPPATAASVATPDPVSDLASASDALPVDTGPVDTGPADTGPVEARPAPVGEVATPNHDPHHVRLSPPAAAQPVSAPNHDADLASAPMPSFALNPVALRAEPEPAAPEPTAPSAPAFADTDTMLYAKDSARLRAAPSTAADVLTKLAADTPLRATARSTDGKWWRVSLDDGRIAYVHRTAVTKQQMAKTEPPKAPAPVIADAPPQQPASARHNQGLLGYVDKTVNWLSDTARRGSPPTVVRPEH